MQNLLEDYVLTISFGLIVTKTFTSLQEKKSIVLIIYNTITCLCKKLYMLLGSEITWGKYVLQFRGSNPKYSLAVPSFGGKHIQVKMVGNILAYRRLCLNCYNIFINNLMDLES